MSDAPASYTTYAADRTDPRFTDWLCERAEPEWTSAVEHPFTRELVAGTLSEHAFADYLVQDYAFIDALIGTFGFAIGQTPDMASKRPLVEFLDTVTDEENDYFERSFDALDVPASRWVDPELTETTAALIDLLGRAACEGGYEETLAVLVPAEWIYEQWATTAAEKHGTGDESDPPSAGVDVPFYYAEWIDLHAGPSFVDFVDWLRGQLDNYGPDVSTRRQARIDRLFQRTVELEVAFFETAYQSAAEGNRDGQKERR